MSDPTPSEPTQQRSVSSQVELHDDFLPPSSDPPPPPAIEFDISTILIGPIMGALTFILHAIGLPPLFIITTLTIVGLCYAYRAQLSAELLLRLLTRFIVHVFFREVNSRNAHKIPKSGPIIFVCAPHANQYLDPAVMMEFVSRPVSFLIAAKSYRDKTIGKFARAQRSIPVERPQDLAVPCDGTIYVNELEVYGIGTKFQSDFNSSDSILFNSEIVGIATIHSDTHLTLKSIHPATPSVTQENAVKYKRVPKINQHDVFKHVWATLKNGNCVGIFPEGGSHDRTDLLPLKAGVAIMALGAAAMYDVDVKLIAVGLNYFHGHRFRGRVYVEYGDPFSLPQNLVQEYKAGGSAKINACNQLLDLIRDQLKSVTVSAPSWEQLQLLWAVRRLYQPSGIRLPPKFVVVLIRRLAEGYELMKDRPEVKAVTQEVFDYNEQLKHYGLRDHQVNITQLNRAYAFGKLIYRVGMLLGLSIMAIPGALLNLPLLVITRWISRRKQEEALRNSNVKIAGRDVLGSWKVLVSLTLVPLVMCIYPILVALIGILLGYSGIYVWGNFVILQPIMMWSAVRFAEIGINILKSLHPLYLAVIRPNNENIIQLRKTRKLLRRRIRSLIDKLGTQLYGEENFQKIRLFPSFREDDDDDDRDIELSDTASNISVNDRIRDDFNSDSDHEVPLQRSSSTTISPRQGKKESVGGGGDESIKTDDDAHVGKPTATPTHQLPPHDGDDDSKSTQTDEDGLHQRKVNKILHDPSTSRIVSPSSRIPQRASSASTVDSEIVVTSPISPSTQPQPNTTTTTTPASGATSTKKTKPTTGPRTPCNYRVNEDGTYEYQGGEKELVLSEEILQRLQQDHKTLQFNEGYMTALSSVALQNITNPSNSTTDTEHEDN